MANNNQIVRFIPDRPIYLSTENTGFKTEVEVIHAVEQLRDRGYLCVYSADGEIRPFHMAFSDLAQFEQFKKACNELKITLKSPIIHADAIESLERKEKITVKPEPTKTFEDSKGHIHVE